MAKPPSDRTLRSALAIRIRDTAAIRRQVNSTPRLIRTTRGPRARPERRVCQQTTAVGCAGTEQPVSRLDVIQRSRLFSLT